MFIKIRDNVDLKELEKFGFKNGIYQRIIKGNLSYMVVVTSTHRYLQIKYAQGHIAGSLQTLIYDLIEAGLVEKVECE